jgi:hypothetical protein
MARIEKGLHEYFASVSDNESESAPEPTIVRPVATVSAPRTETRGADPLVAFARVNSVAGGSPAQLAGLEVGDGVKKMGDIEWTRYGTGSLAQVPELVGQSIGVSLELLSYVSLYG